MSKTFALSLRNKNWINSALPQVLFKANISGMYLAGGFIRALFDRSKVDDFDLFFRDEDALCKFKKHVSSVRAKTVFVCPEGKLTTYKIGPWKVQCITERYFQNMEELINTFDITASMWAWDGSILVCGDTTIRDTKKKILRLNRVMYPAATFKRLKKYSDKGYQMDRQTIESYIIGSMQTAEISGDSASMWRFYID